jgi:hypothetical protein
VVDLFVFCPATLSPGGASSEAGFPAKRWHGLLSMMGWGVLLPIGTMVARYFRRQDPYWFYGHMAVQGVGFLVGIAAVIIGFRLDEDGLKNIFVHKAIGITILAMASLQVCIGHHCLSLIRLAYFFPVTWGRDCVEIAD